MQTRQIRNRRTGRLSTGPVGPSFQGSVGGLWTATGGESQSIARADYVHRRDGVECPRVLINRSIWPQ